MLAKLTQTAAPLSATALERATHALMVLPFAKKLDGLRDVPGLDRLRAALKRRDMKAGELAKTPVSVPGGELYAKFYVAEGLELTSADYDDGVVTFKFKYVPSSNPTLSVPIGPFDKGQLTKLYTPVFDSSGRPIGGREEDTNVVTIFVPVEREEVVTVVNEETKKKPTVEVVTLDPMPQVVEVALEKVAEVVDKKSDEPQATIVLSDATFEVSDNVVTDVVKTEEGKSDVVIAVTDFYNTAAGTGGR